MAERRSLGEAMLTPDKLAFIHAGLPTEPAKVSAKSTPTKPVPDEEDVAATAEEAEPVPSRPRSRSRAARRSHAQPMSNYGDFQGFANLLVPHTTRLQPATALALRRAGLEQRLRGQEPATVQEIAEEALAKWLRDAGYLE